MSKKNKKSKALVYIPFGDSEFGMEEMFAQGAAALDIAAILAIRNGDVESLINVGSKYIDMANAINGIEPHSQEIKLGFGFCMEGEIEDVRSDSECEDDD